MFIDNQFLCINEEQEKSAREQLELPGSYHLIDAAIRLQHDTGNGVVTIPLPKGILVAVFENNTGQQKFGVVTIEGLNYL
jgi:hypothetical protein